MGLHKGESKGNGGGRGEERKGARISMMINASCGGT